MFSRARWRNKNMASGRQLAVVKIKTIISETEKILYTERKHIKKPRWYWKQIYRLLIHNTDYKPRILLGQQ